MMEPECAELYESLMLRFEEHFGSRGVQSGSQTPEAFEFFYTVLRRAEPRWSSVDFLEIGSYNGVSMAVIGHLLRELGLVRTLVSVDPYFDAGYSETPPRNQGEPHVKPATLRAYDKARALYRALDLPVDIVRTESARALSAFITSCRSFDLVFVDGMHEGLHPMTDVGLAMNVLRPRSVLMIDDTPWPDIAPVKALCDRHLMRIHQIGNKAAYWNRKPAPKPAPTPPSRSTLSAGG